MKKNILFVLNSLNIGGAEKSLVTILNMFDYEKYDVDLFLFGVEGELLNQLPSNVNLLPQDEDYNYFCKNKVKSILHFFKKFKFKKSLYSLMYLLGYVFYKIFKRNEIYIGWTFKKYIIGKMEKKYDTTIGFLERSPLYYSVDNVDAKIKIGFVHNDYSKYKYNYNLDKKYFDKCSKIVTVSNHCKDVLCDIFPQYKEKFIVIKNIVDKNYIEEKAKEDADIKNKFIKTEKDCINIVTVARLVEQKGIDNAIKICYILNKKGINVRWYVVGGGQEESNLKKLIAKYQLEEKFILVGEQTNPYIWMKNCDIYVQPSRFEGYGITIAEAKCLNKLIIATKIPEFEEQIEDGVTGILVKNNNEFANKIIEITKDDIYKNNILKNLKDLADKGQNELNKIYDII